MHRSPSLTARWPTVARVQIPTHDTSICNGQQDVVVAREEELEAHAIKPQDMLLRIILACSSMIRDFWRLDVDADLKQE